MAGINRELIKLVKSDMRFLRTRQRWKGDWHDRADEAWDVCPEPEEHGHCQERYDRHQEGYEAAQWPLLSKILPRWAALPSERLAKPCDLLQRRWVYLLHDRYLWTAHRALRNTSWRAWYQWQHIDCLLAHMKICPTKQSLSVVPRTAPPYAGEIRTPGASRIS